MRFLLIVDDYLPNSIKVAAKMMHELAIEFLRHGHEVTVLTPAPFLHKKTEMAELDGIKVLYFRSGKIKNTGKIERAINESLLSIYARNAAKAYLKKNKCDKIVYYSPSIFWGLLVKYLKKRCTCKAYLILRDIFPQWTVDNGLIRKNSLIHRYFKYFETINYKHADKIGVMSPSNLDLFAARQDFRKFEVLFNWAHPEKVTAPGDTYRKQLGLEDKTVLFYGGNIGQAQQMMNLVDLAIRFKSNKKIHFLFVGTGDEVDLVKEEKEKNKLDNLSYLPPVDQRTYARMLNEFDIGLFSLHPGHKTHNFPGKLLGYMTHSKPILGCVNSGNDLKNMVNNARAGMITDTVDKDELYNAAKALTGSESLRKEMGENGRRLLLKHFSVESAAQTILKALDD